ncbi:MAG: hypothetical protein ABSA30_14355, partial [Candidatus Aminicenantales bacterium]
RLVVQANLGIGGNDLCYLVHAQDHCGVKVVGAQFRDHLPANVAYLASLDCPELTQSAIDWLAGPLPVTVTPSDKQAILTYQEKSKRWILHLLSDGPYTLHLADIGPIQVVLQYPADQWSYKAQLGKDGLQIKVDGEAQDRLLVLE